MADRFSLAGRVALITGASSGFGEHFARVLAEAGAAGVIAARRKDKLDSLAAELTAEGHNVAAVSMDVTDDESIVSAFDAAQEAMGGKCVDLLVNNAGIAAPNIALRISADEWDSLMGTNLRGA